MNYKSLLALLLIPVLYGSCKEKKSTVTQTPEIIQPAIKNLVSAYSPTRMVRSVKQAKNGDILIASYTGLWRYDGKMFTNITTAISSPSIWDVLEDKKGNLWIGTKDSGLYYYDGKSFLHYTTRQGLPSNMALQLFEDKAGNIWTNSGGATRFDGKSFKTYTTKDGLPDNGVNTFMEDKNGKLWIGTRGDACYFDGKNFTVFKNKEGKPFHNVWLIVEDQKGMIWFGSINGVYRWDGKDLTNFQGKQDQVYNIDQKQSQITWKGSMKISAAEKHVGYVSISKGELWVENNRLVGGAATIDMNAMEYADKKDKNTPIQHLQSEDYFDVKRFPFATIEISQVDSLTDKAVQITGYLTIKTVSRLVSFPAIIDIQNGVLNATAKFSIDRTQWGISFMSGKFYEKMADEIVSDEIDFEIKIVAKK